MRCALLTGILSAITILSGLAASGNAQAVSARVPNLDAAPRFSSATACGFRVHENREYRQTQLIGLPAPVGTIVTRAASKFVLRVVNHRSHALLFARAAHAPAHKFSSPGSHHIPAGDLYSDQPGRHTTRAPRNGHSDARQRRDDCSQRQRLQERDRLPGRARRQAETDRSWSAFGPTTSNEHSPDGAAPTLRHGARQDRIRDHTHQTSVGHQHLAVGAADQHVRVVGGLSERVQPTASRTAASDPHLKPAR
jgi:hypothetical protein